MIETLHDLTSAEVCVAADETRLSFIRSTKCTRAAKKMQHHGETWGNTMPPMGKLKDKAFGQVVVRLPEISDILAQGLNGTVLVGHSDTSAKRKLPLLLCIPLALTSKAINHKWVHSRSSDGVDFLKNNGLARGNKKHQLETNKGFETSQQNLESKGEFSF